MNQLRSLEPGDIPQIVALRRRVFSHSSLDSDSELARYYHMLFFENPWHDARFPSFVQEGSNGEIVGAVGAIPRPMLLGGERITAITSTELMVAPEARGFLGPKLFRRLFDGAQDLTFSDRCNAQAKAIYEGLGGNAALWYSLYWSAPLDGTRVSFEAAGTGKSYSLAARVLRRAGRYLDRLAVGSSPRKQLEARAEPLAPDTVVTLMKKLAAKNTLVPEYETHAFKWLLQRLSERPNAGRIVTAQIVQNGEPIGWFVYAARTDGDVDVVQLVALPGREGLVFDHLVHHAAAEGGSVLRGRLDRRFAPAISDRELPLTVGQPWTVVRSARQDLSGQFLTGNALFTRLDAEWWIGT